MSLSLIILTSICSCAFVWVKHAYNHRRFMNHKAPLRGSKVEQPRADPERLCSVPKYELKLSRIRSGKKSMHLNTERIVRIFSSNMIFNCKHPFLRLCGKKTRNTWSFVISRKTSCGLKMHVSRCCTKPLKLSLWHAPWIETNEDWNLGNISYIELIWKCWNERIFRFPDWSRFCCWQALPNDPSYTKTSVDTAG